MDFINSILKFIFNIINFLIPVFNIDPEFVNQLDAGLTLFIALLEGVAYFIPLDIFVICFTVMIAIDNFAIAVRIGQFIVKLIRG